MAKVICLLFSNDKLFIYFLFFLQSLILKFSQNITFNILFTLLLFNFKGGSTSSQSVSRKLKTILEFYIFLFMCKFIQLSSPLTHFDTFFSGTIISVRRIHFVNLSFIFINKFIKITPIWGQTHKIKLVKLLVTHLHFPFNGFKGVWERLSHSRCNAAVNEVLQRSEAKRRLLPQLVQIHVNRIASDWKGNRTCRRRRWRKWKIIQYRCQTRVLNKGVRTQNGEGESSVESGQAFIPVDLRDGVSCADVGPLSAVLDDQSGFRHLQRIREQGGSDASQSAG